MQTTSNLGLKKPEGTDLVDIADLNGNADILDGKFATTGGHGHTGAVGDGPKLGASSLVAGAGTDTIIGNRTIADATAPTADTGTLTSLLGWLAYMVKAITGKSSWRTTPSKTLEDLNNHIGAGGGAHADVTTTADGFMTAADKVKLDGIATGANKYTHPNHTGDVTSSGDGVTAIAPGVIVDADVNNAAAIGWGKINKSGASLADLPTRSAADLSSGTLPAARLPAMTGDVTSPAGSSVMTIAPGIIDNANINAAAGIDATKIGPGTVSNTEFGYLDGVTSGIQTQLNGKETPAGAQAKANAAESNAKAYADGKFVSTDGNTEHIEFRKNMNTEGPAYIDFHTSGNTSTDWDARIIAEVSGRLGLSAADNIFMDAGTTYTRDKLWVRPDFGLGTSSDLHVAIGDSDTGFKWIGDGYVDIRSNGTVAAVLSDGWLRLRSEDNNYYHTGYFWGNHTRLYRPFGSLNHTPVAQSISAGVWTKINLTGVSENQQGICNPSNARFVMPQDGSYLLVARIGFGRNSSSLTGLRLGVYLNGTRNSQIGEMNGFISDGITLTGSTLLTLNAGTVVEIYGYSDQPATISQSDEYSHVSMIRVA